MAGYWKAAGGGFFEHFCTRMCLPDVEILTFAVPVFVPICHSSLPISYKKHQFRSNWVFFRLICFKYTHIYVNWAPSSTKPSDCYKKICEQAPKKQVYILIPCQCENLPPVRQVVSKNTQLGICNTKPLKYQVAAIILMAYHNHSSIQAKWQWMMLQTP